MLQSGLVSLPVVERFDVVEQNRPQLRLRDVFPIAVNRRHVTLDRRPRRLHRGVVKTVSGRPVGRSEIPIRQSVRELERGVLTPAIRMVNQFSVRLTKSKRHHQRVDNKVSGLAFAHRPSTGHEDRRSRQGTISRPNI